MAFRRSPVRTRSGPPAFAHDRMRRLSCRSPEGRRRTSSLAFNLSRASARQAERRGTLQPAFSGIKELVLLRWDSLPKSRTPSTGAHNSADSDDLFEGISFATRRVMSGRRLVYVLRELNRRPAFLCRSHLGRRGRLADHHAGRCPHTACHRPWQVHVVDQFPDQARAIRFERYLKSGSGRAFAKRHFEP